MRRIKLLSFIILSIIILSELYFVFWLWGFGRIGRVYTNNYFNPAFFKFGKFNVLGVSKSQLIEEMKKFDPQLHNATITKKINGDIYVKITERDKRYILTDKNENKYYYADERGVVISEGKDENKLVIVTGKASLKQGSTMDLKSEKLALLLADRLDKYPSFNGKQKIVIEGDKFRLFFSRGFVVILPLEEDIDSYLKSLQILLDRFTIEGRLPQEIDLRFSKPVIKI